MKLCPQCRSIINNAMLIIFISLSARLQAELCFLSPPIPIFGQVRVFEAADHKHHLVEDLGEPGQPEGAGARLG